MADRLVATKLLLPRARREVVPRPRLAALLRRAADAPVTLVSAPAGFGKTTLLSTWLREHPARPVAWVALDQDDRTATSFWTYLLTALDRAAPGTAAAALTVLRSGSAPITTALAGVVNEVSVHPGDLTLMLDDYHLADGPDVAEGMTFLVDHLPAQLHLVISTRADPGLPLSRLRARGELVEIRAADLRFDADEVAAYLNDVNRLALPADAVAALATRTEGWAAALQLAALSLHDRADAAGFIERFTGDDRHVVDYLADEVLDRLPHDTRRFLLDTAVLDALTGPLCEAVSPSRPGGHVMLESLERQNLFVVPLDDRRRWYRYHHLFGDVLRAHLYAERPSDVAALHHRASRWYAAAGRSEDAVRHALAAGDFEAAAELVERAIPDLRRRRREDLIRRWAYDLPATVVHGRPVLAIGLIGGLMSSNDFAGVEPRLRDLQDVMRQPPSSHVVVDHDELRRVPAAIEMYWAALALLGGDPATAIGRAEQAVAAALGDDLTASAASGIAGLAHWTLGDVAAAHAAYTATAQGLTRVGHIADVLGCSLTLADMELTLGRLGDAERTLERALALAGAHPPGGGGVVRGTADMLVALSRTAWHRDDLSAAADLLRRADDLGEPAGLAQNPYRWRVALARLRAAERDWPGALQLLEEAQRVYVGDYSPPVHPIPATRARLLAASGDLTAARAWARGQGLGVDDELSYLREYEHVTLAMLMLSEHGATGRPEPLAQAVSLLGRLLAAATSGGRSGTVLELEVLRTLALWTAGEPEAAMEALNHAIDLAEPDGWVRFFVDAGPALAEPMAACAAARPRSAFVQHLLQSLPTAGGSAVDQAPPPAPSAGRPLIDPLSERELDVLRLLRSDLDGPGIARELVVSLNTVRTHTKHIYTKLGVNSRRAAVSKAHQLGLLGHG